MNDATKEAVEIRLARIEEHVKSINEKLGLWKQCRHVTSDGECDFLTTVVAHDRKISEWGPLVKKIDEHDAKINQWTGALAATSAVSAFIGALIATIMARFWK